MMKSVASEMPKMFLLKTHGYSIYTYDDKNVQALVIFADYLHVRSTDITAFSFIFSYSYFT